jgi:hypothetical protein
MKKAFFRFPGFLYGLILIGALGLTIWSQQNPAKVQAPPAESKMMMMTDLQISISRCPGTARAGQELGASFKVTATNAGRMPVRDVAVDIVLSRRSHCAVPTPVAVYSPNYSDGVLLKGGREHISLNAGETKEVTLNGTNKIPDDTPSGTYFLCAVIDAGNKVPEINETNNCSCCSIQITGCPAIADIVNPRILEASGGTVGPARIKLAWSFSPATAEKPTKLQITIYRQQADGTWYGVMPMDAPYEVTPPSSTVADVGIFRLFSGNHKIVFKAWYSCNRIKEFTFILPV